MSDERDEKYEAFKRQVEWDGWSSITRKKFDELFPEVTPSTDLLKWSASN